MGDREVVQLAWQQVAACGRPLRVTSLQRTAILGDWSEFPRSFFTNAPRVDRSLVDERGFRLAHSRLGRQIRRLEKLGVSLRIHPGSDSAVVRRLYDCKRAHFAADSEHLFVDQRRCDFMVAAAALPESRCEVFTLENDGADLIAGLVNFRDGDIRRCYTIYFHPEWARHSPGIALLYEVTARSLGEGLSCDYMTGEYPYKLRLANTCSPLYKVELNAEELAEIAAPRRVPKVA
jgi:hypothetical protein